MSEPGPSLVASSLSVRGPDGRPALRYAHVSAPPRTLTAVAGAGGTGATCLLLALAGRLRPSTGTVRLGVAGNGATATTAAVPGASTPRRELRERVLVARATGAAEPDSYETVGELVRSAHRYLRRRVPAAAVETSLGRVGLGGLVRSGRHRRYGTLTPVERLLLAVALVLPGEADAVVVDAVDRDLDDASRQRAWSALSGAAEHEGGPLIVATCDSAEGARIGGAHQVVALSDHQDPGSEPRDSSREGER
ncbi:hypothetical protein BIV57_18670 [Mangrovactinospora gilvigrisea]|uniref:ABC transporter ATP-binding protein n=1 Tax=Mangrovactinospora gilvigrisea TaxID=1428644 RepID=A0A1J7C367_9ACTN|nr:hypothetical protein [Mangrovactinospora gilvigrisea]OIV36000.1 hypothetical protein BIV57_18670 [Mangrovactinospora gilvigrisea]